MAFFSIIDVLQVLIENDRPRKYWSDLKTRLQREGSEVSEKIGQLNFIQFFLKDLQIVTNSKMSWLQIVTN